MSCLLWLWTPCGGGATALEYLGCLLLLRSWDGCLKITNLKENR
jgi:hypothetical protein